MYNAYRSNKIKDNNPVKSGISITCSQMVNLCTRWEMLWEGGRGGGKNIEL